MVHRFTKREIVTGQPPESSMLIRAGNLKHVKFYCLGFSFCGYCESATSSFSQIQDLQYYHLLHDIYCSTEINCAESTQT